MKPQCRRDASHMYEPLLRCRLITTTAATDQQHQKRNRRKRQCENESEEEVAATAVNLSCQWPHESHDTQHNTQSVLRKREGEKRADSIEIDHTERKKRGIVVEGYGKQTLFFFPPPWAARWPPRRLATCREIIVFFFKKRRTTLIKV